MSVLPVSKVGKIEFCEDHVSPWTTNAVAIGTTAGAVTAWETKVEAARAAYQAQQAAQNAAKAATNDFNLAMDAMVNATSDIIKQIKAQAAITGGSVYSLAEIPAPATPSPKPAPGTPTDFGVELDGDGSLILTWKGNNPVGTSGTMYQVWRSTTGSEGEFLYCGGCGEKRYVDSTVPAGVTAVTYKIQGVRSTAVGLWATFNVFFGTNAGGAMTASIADAPKMAA